MTVKTLLASCIVLFAGIGLAEESAKKVIEWGWDEPDTKFIRENIETMEQHPFDGLVFHVTSSKGGNFTWEMWGGRKYDLSEFQHSIDNLKATKFQRLTDRFLRVNVTPGKTDWFDDEAWGTVLNNFAVATQVAKQGGCKGFMFDVEQYNDALFDYEKQKHRETKTFAEYQAKVRQRGREWMAEVNRHFPDITVLLTFGYRIAQPPEGKSRSESHYGLLADFLDGMLEDCSEQTKIVDAWEYSYPYKEHGQFEEAYKTVKEKSVEWTAQPDKYRRHIQAGFGIWMDCRWRQVGWNLDDFSKNHFTPEEFGSALRAALDVSDEYVWIYTEQPRWWTNERLPTEYAEVLQQAREPHKNGDRAQVVRLIFDTDMMGDVDDVGTTAVLHALANQGEVEILAMGLSGKNQWSPLCLDAVNTYFRRPDIPIGVVKGPAFDKRSKYAETIAKEFPHKLKSAEDAPDAAMLYRKILAEQADKSVVMVSVGQVTNFRNLLKTGPDNQTNLGGVELVKQKVKVWVCMGGKIPEGREANLIHDGPAAAYTIANWPTPIIFSGWEIGQEIMTGAGLRKAPEGTPVRRAYELYNGLNDRQSWDQTAVLYAVRGLDGGLNDYWDLETEGYLQVNQDGSNAWRTSTDKDHAYLAKKMEPKKIAEVIEDLMLQSPQTKQ